MANVQTRDILVGAADFYIADFGTALPAFGDEENAVPAFGAALGSVPATLKEKFSDAESDWNYMGATQEGLELAYSPEYGEVEIDQSKDAAIMFNQSLSLTANTNLAEATLENLIVAWGVDSYYLDNTSGHVSTFSIGVPGDDPVERSAVWVGKGASYTAGATETPLTEDTEYRRERVYHARRVISIEGSTVTARRTEATTFPVSFRLLPDPRYGQGGTLLDTGEVPSEYGQIIDRIPGVATPTGP